MMAGAATSQRTTAVPAKGRIEKVSRAPLRRVKPVVWGFKAKMAQAMSGIWI